MEGMAENGENPVAKNYPPHVTSPESLAWVTCVETVAHDRSVIVDNFKIKVKTDERHTWRPACTYSASPTAAHMYWHLRGGDDGGAGGHVMYILYSMSWWWWWHHGARPVRVPCPPLQLAHLPLPVYQ